MKETTPLQKWYKFIHEVEDEHAIAVKCRDEDSDIVIDTVFDTYFRISYIGNGKVQTAVDEIHRLMKGIANYAAAKRIRYNYNIYETYNDTRGKTYSGKIRYYLEAKTFEELADPFWVFMLCNEIFHDVNMEVELRRTTNNVRGYDFETPTPRDEE